jgi:hypothetical protein
MFLYSALALNGGVMVGTIPSAVYRSKNGGWEELAGVRLHSAGANFPPSPELQSRTRVSGLSTRKIKSACTPASKSAAWC